MHEYDTVEVTTDHPELSPELMRGAQGIIVDLPDHSSLAAVEFTLPGNVEVFLVELAELRLVSAAAHTGLDASPD